MKREIENFMILLPVAILVIFLSFQASRILIYYSELMAYKRTEVKISFRSFLSEINSITERAANLNSDLAKFGVEAYLEKDLPEFSLNGFAISHLVDRIKNEPVIFGGGLWFEPFTLKSKYDTIYLFWDQEDIKITSEYSNESYNHHNHKFYSSVAEDQLKKTVRKYIYKDKIQGKEDIFITISAPILNKQSKLIGVSTVDWTINFLRKLLLQFYYTKNSFFVLLDAKSKTILFHPEESFALKKIDSLEWGSKIAIKDEMGRNEVFIENIEVKGEDYEVYYSLTNMDFILVAVIHKKEVYGDIGKAVIASIPKFFFLWN